MLSVKNNDCFICALAEVEGIPWKLAKRKTRKFRESKKDMGCMTHLMKMWGVKGFDIIYDKRASDIAGLFDYHPGVLLVHFGNNAGHAMAWNGYRIIDNGPGRYSKMNNSNFYLLDDDRINLVLRKKNVGRFTLWRNKLYCYLLAGWT